MFHESPQALARAATPGIFPQAWAIPFPAADECGPEIQANRFIIL